MTKLSRLPQFLSTLRGINRYCTAVVFGDYKFTKEDIDGIARQTFSSADGKGVDSVYYNPDQDEVNAAIMPELRESKKLLLITRAILDKKNPQGATLTRNRALAAAQLAFKHEPDFFDAIRKKNLDAIMALLDVNLEKASSFKVETNPRMEGWLEQATPAKEIAGVDFDSIEQRNAELRESQRKISQIRNTVSGGDLCLRAGLFAKDSGNELKAQSFFIRAFEIFGNLAKEGDLDAKCNLGLCYLEGYGVKKNPAEAMKLFEVSNTQDARFHYARITLFGDDGVEPNPQKALEIFQELQEEKYDGDVEVDVFVKMAHDEIKSVRTSPADPQAKKLSPEKDPLFLD